MTFETLIPELDGNPVATVLMFTMLAIFGWGGWKGLIALRKDWAGRKMEELDVAEAVQRLAADTLNGVRKELEGARDELRQAREDLRLSRIENDQLRCQNARYESHISMLQRDIGVLVGWISDRFPTAVTDMPHLASDTDTR